MAGFAVNTYPYTQSMTVTDCLKKLAGAGFSAFELMLFPGHLWPGETSAPSRAALRQFLSAETFQISALNMPNIDINITGATREMRDYSLKALTSAVELAGDLEIGCVLIGPGKANPLLSLPKDQLRGYLFNALDVLTPAAKRAGTRLAIENLPFAFLPDAAGIMDTLNNYGDPDIGVIFDFANAIFAKDDPIAGLRRVRDRLHSVHVSDTPLDRYRHDPVGEGVVPFATIAPALAEIAPQTMTVLEIIGDAPDRQIPRSMRNLLELGWAGTA